MISPSTHPFAIRMDYTAESADISPIYIWFSPFLRTCSSTQSICMENTLGKVWKQKCICLTEKRSIRANFFRGAIRVVSTSIAWTDTRILSKNKINNNDNKCDFHLHVYLLSDKNACVSSSCEVSIFCILTFFPSVSNKAGDFFNNAFPCSFRFRFFKRC